MDYVFTGNHFFFSFFFHLMRKMRISYEINVIFRCQKTGSRFLLLDGSLITGKYMIKKQNSFLMQIFKFSNQNEGNFLLS